MIKKISYVLAATAVVLVAAFLIYKYSDEKLKPEAADFFANDPELATKIVSTENFFSSVPIKKLAELDTNLCAKKATSEEEKKDSLAIDQLLENKNDMVEKASQLVAMKDLVYSNTSQVELINEVNKSRYLLRIIELKICNFQKKGQLQEQRKELSRLLDLSLNVLENPNPFISNMVFAGIADTVLSKLKEAGASKADLSVFKTRINNLQTDEIFNRSANAEAKTLLNTVTKWSDGTVEENELRNPLEIAAQYLMMKAFHVLYFSRMEDSQRRLIEKTENLKALVN